MADAVSRRRHRGTVRLRLTGAVTLLVLVVGGFVAAWFVQRVESSLVDDAEDRNADLLDDLAASLANGEDPRDLLLPFQVALPAGTAPAAAPDQAFFVAGPGFDAPGTVVVFQGDAGVALASDQFGSTKPVSDGPTIETQLRPEDATEIAAGGGLVGTADLAVASLPVSSAAGTGELIAASPLDDVRNSVDTLSRGLWLAVPALALAMGGLAWMVTGRALRPVEAIARQADEITATNLHQRVPEPTTDDEVAHLARTVNGMLSRLEDGADRQRRFVSDASHELRSPVSAIRTQVEVGLLNPDTDWDRVGQTVLNESARLERLIDDLLTLARTSELAAHPETSAGSLARCDLRDVVTTEAGRSRSTPVEVHLEGDDSVWVGASETDVERVLCHLLDNAARHARAVVQVSVRPGTDAVNVLVDDDGPGIAPDDRQRVLERFTRLDEGRARDEGGTGLGLAVVAEVMHAIGGVLTVEESPLGGARIRMLLPAAPSP